MSMPPFNPPPPPPFVPGPPTSGGEYPPPPPPPQPRGSRTKWIVGGVVAVVALCCGGSAIMAAVAPDPAPLPAAALPSATSTVSPSPSASTSSPAPAPSTSSPAAVKAATPAATPAKPKPPTFAKVSSRAWSKIARDPEANAGKAIIVYGAITQFDSATGNDMFRANVDGVRHREWYEYDTNTVLTADEALIDDLANEDMFEAKVIVSGEFSYESTFGSELSTPELRIVSIKRIR